MHWPRHYAPVRLTFSPGQMQPNGLAEMDKLQKQVLQGIGWPPFGVT